MTPLDTSQTANDIQLNILKKMSGIGRLRIAIDLSELARKLAFTRIENEHPGLSKPPIQFSLSVPNGEILLTPTWVSVSPDGRWFLFETSFIARAKVWLRPSDSSEARRLMDVRDGDRMCDSTSSITRSATFSSCTTNVATPSPEI